MIKFLKLPHLLFYPKVCLRKSVRRVSLIESISLNTYFWAFAITRCSSGIEIKIVKKQKFLSLWGLQSSGGNRQETHK